MAKQENKAENTKLALPAMVTGYISLSGSRDFYTGLSDKVAGFDSLSEAEQNAELLRCQKLGQQRRKEHQAKAAALAKEGKAMTISVIINGTKVSGEVVFSEKGEGDSLYARIAFPVTTNVVVEEKKASKRKVASFLGL